MIASAGVLILISAFWGGGSVTLDRTDWVMVLLFAGSFFLLRRTKLNPILVMLLAGALNLVRGLLAG